MQTIEIISTDNEIIRRQIMQTTWKKAYGHILNESEIEQFFQGKLQEKRTWLQLSCLPKKHFFAQYSGQTVGIATYSLGKTPHAELNSLYVLPDKQNQGIGSLLWEAVLTEMRTAKMQEMQIWVMAAARSKEFYLRQGCRKIARGDYYVGSRLIEAWCYAKSL